MSDPIKKIRNYSFGDVFCGFVIGMVLGAMLLLICQ